MMPSSTSLLDRYDTEDDTPRPPSVAIRFANGAVHWIIGLVLIYALVRNGETSGAMINPTAMRSEVKLGLIVGFIFLLRLPGREERDLEAAAGP